MGLARGPTGIVWILVALGLWALQPWARLVALVIAGLALLEAVLAFFQFTGTGIGFGMAIMPLLFIWYLNSSEVKAAFGEGQPEPSAPTASPQPVAVPAPAPERQAVAAAPAAALAVAAPMAAAAATEPAAPPPVSPPVVAAAVAAEKPRAAHHMDIEDVAWISAADREKLAAAGIRTTDDLLTAGAKPYDREKIAAATGISGTRIREWVDSIDLMRVPGVGPQYSNLLEAAGVDSPAELAQRNPANLAITVQEVVAARPGIVHHLPSEAEVASWVDEARRLDKLVEH